MFKRMESQTVIAIKTNILKSHQRFVKENVIMMKHFLIYLKQYFKKKMILKVYLNKLEMGNHQDFS